MYRIPFSSLPATLTILFFFFYDTAPPDLYTLSLHDALPIHDEILDKAYDPRRNTFTQSYGSEALDAGALMVGLVGLLPPTDDRFTGTIDAVRSELGHDGFISRYSTDATDDGL